LGRHFGSAFWVGILGRHFGSAFWVGIDVCQAALDGHILPQALVTQYPNPDTEMQRLLSDRQPHPPH